ncbi:MAG: DNA cytosine methyltransferase [Rikenellaceae bacterium]
MKVIDLFAGCGGLSLGFQQAGFEVVAAFENWKQAVDVYKQNFNHPIIPLDLSNVEDYSIFTTFSPDVIIGGPPCQDFSSAGKRDEDNGRGDLTIQYANIIKNVKPQWFVMENVERILKTNKLQEALRIFKNAGYGVSYKVFDASLCGVPQKRKRFFLIGKYGEQDGFLDKALSENLAGRSMTIFDYLGDSLGIEYYYRHPRSYMRRGVFSIYEPSPTVRGVNRPLPRGYKKHTGDPVDSIDGVRPLTTIERSYIQTFPKDFNFFGTKTDLEQMIGNAVPVNLAKHVALRIISYVNNSAKYRIEKTLFD